MSLNAAEIAAIPTARAAIAAVKAFDIAMGPDPLQWAVKYPGSKLVLIGTLQNLVPSLAVAEGGALQSLVSEQLDSWDAILAKAEVQGSSGSAAAGAASS